MKKPFMPWFDKLERVYQFVVIVVFACGLLGSLLSVAITVNVRMTRKLIGEQVRPLQEGNEFLIDRFGLMTEFEQFKADKERKAKAFGPVSERTLPYPLLRSN